MDLPVGGRYDGGIKPVRTYLYPSRRVNANLHVIVDPVHVILDLEDRYK